MANARKELGKRLRNEQGAEYKSTNINEEFVRRFIKIISRTNFPIYRTEVMLKTERYIIGKRAA